MRKAGATNWSSSTLDLEHFFSGDTQYPASSHRVCLARRRSSSISWSSNSRAPCRESSQGFRYCDDGQLVRVEKILAALKVCSNSKDLKQGRIIHADATSSGDISDFYVANSLINMYAKCGSMADARKVFDAMKARTAASWTALMFGYAENGHPELALELFQRMIQLDYAPDARSLVAAVQACIKMAEAEDGKRVGGKSLKLQALEKGMAIHYEAAKLGGMDTDIFVGNTLVNLYAKCGSMVEARRIFDRIKFHNVVSWTSLLMGYAENGEGELVLALFSSIQEERGPCAPNARTYVAALKACTNLAEAEEGQQVDGRIVKMRSLEKGLALHSRAAKLGFVENMYLASTLVDMYARCGSLLDAREAFERMPNRDVVSWNVLILRYVDSGDGEQALESFARMSGRADSLSCVAALKACTNLAYREENRELDGKMVKVKSLERGMAVYSLARRKGFHTDIFVANTTIDMYGKCGVTADARKVFDRMPLRTLVSYNALMLGYAENQEGKLGLDLLAEMDSDRSLLEEPDGRTFAAALKSCGSEASLQAGKYVHARVCSSSLETDAVLVTCLLHAYGKCGSLVDAHLVFDSVSGRVLETWTALMAGYSQLGDTEQVFDLFYMMQDEGLQPDGITFVCLLTVCSHGGLVETGKKLFRAMISKYRIKPFIEHYHCMVDILGRANELDAALALVDEMPFKPSAVTWMTVLGACVKWKNVAVGRIAFEALLEIDEKDAASYMLMAALYRSTGMWKEQSVVEEMRIAAQAWAKTGRSWTDQAGMVHKFVPD
ncbi:pentatricopeptide repeat-containing protein At2g13600-like isoform X1 [Selaginella moellendorffii]|uniref:pentatricopeptide repeat-containing protein At2g13600-like isoform X1 n=1 Tax=Selaginella moellendorffii TaxID=88036 RepID=UPI000D1C384B|nr:pentatricopeptide repeat-containing protein At2g13600-like isoform X1 [Selaginella moellendorffii]|eukprot:XP_024532440.1 pentatricopeptide repeat-containing protein At2g13600-like isoform X1 [Selaginella moellendorffii]